MEYEGHFKSADGLKFYQRGWLPSGGARAHLVLIHGYGEHCSRYAYVGEALNRGGIAVHTYDQRGFGHSPGPRAYIDNFDVLLSDLDRYVALLTPTLDNKPRFFMGHSMGGLVLARYAETRQVEARGFIFSSAFLAFSDDIPKILLKLANVLGTLTPWLPVGGVDNTGLSRDPKVVEAADQDPLAFHGKVKARTGQQFQAAIDRAHADFPLVTTPVLVIHGSADKVVSPEGSRQLYERCGSQDKTLKLYEGGYHEVWNDLDKEVLFADIIRWIAARL